MIGSLDNIIDYYHDKLDYVPGHAFALTAGATVRRTPVDTGELRGSWTPSTGSPDWSNRGGSIATVARAIRVGVNGYFCTSKSYSRVIEYTGHSPQAPGGMMRPSIAEWGGNVSEAVRNAP